MITTLIYIVLPLLLLSLAGGLFFLLVDKGDTGRKRTVYLLGLRVFFAYHLCGRSIQIQTAIEKTK